MQLSTDLTQQLVLLRSSPGPNGEGLAEGLTALASVLTESVSGYAGLRLTVVHTGHPVELTALVEAGSPAEVSSSLRLSLPVVSRAFEEGGRLVVWSTVPGSLVDLAADLAHMLGDPTSVELDVDLPPPAGTASGLRGLQELATIHRAAGLLVGGGHDVGSVHQTMRTRAVEEGLSTYLWAERLLRLRSQDRGGSGG